MFSLKNSGPIKIRDVVQVSKISKAQLSLKSVCSLKCGHGMTNCKQCRGRVGPFFIVDPNGKICMDLYRLCLEWLSQPLRSCRCCILHNHGVVASYKPLSKLLAESNKEKCVFVSKNCSFRDLKHTNANILFCNACKEKNLTFHSNLVFVEEKAFATDDLLKLRFRRDPLTGEVSELMYSHEISARKRCSTMCIMCPFRKTLCNKIFQCTVSEEVGKSYAHQTYLLLNVRRRFLKNETF